MKFNKIEFINKNIGKIKIAPIGFSWTTLFFGFFTALFRKDFKWAFIQFSINIILNIVILFLYYYILWLVFTEDLEVLYQFLVYFFLSILILEWSYIILVVFILLLPIILTSFIINLIMAFNYNNIYIKNLLKKEFIPKDKNELEYILTKFNN